MHNDEMPVPYGAMNFLCHEHLEHETEILYLT